jgi:hypothetical protein
MIMETGVVTLENTKAYPFNDSARTVALGQEQGGTDYFVLTEAVGSQWEIGEVRVYDKAVNGFRMSFTGSARSAKVRYTVLSLHTA